MRPLIGHVAAGGLFLLLSLAFTNPLPFRLTEGVLGAGAGDNMSPIWNIWWARSAIHDQTSLFWTPALFAPIGTSLVLHSFAPLVSSAAALLPGDSLTLYNGALLLSVFLNLMCAYWAAWTITHSHAASLFAAIAFGGAPCLLVRLQGHLNVLSAWGLPLLLIAVRRFTLMPSLFTAGLLAVVFAVVCYVDAYYAIFGGTLVLGYLLLAHRSLVVTARPLTASRRRALRVLAGVVLVLLAAFTWIQLTGGTDVTLGGIELRMTDTFNLRVLAGFVVAIAWLVWKWPTVAAVFPDVPPRRQVLQLMPVVALGALLLTLPLSIAALRVWWNGDYESQLYLWRSAPPGIDLAALVLGNPVGFLSGRWTSSLSGRLGIDRFESAVWIGVAPLLLFAWAIKRLRSHSETGTYLWMTGLFFVWSVGPYLRVFGLNTAVMLPETLIRFVPIAGNARIPGRAFIVCQLLIAMIGAIALSSFRHSRSQIAALAIAAVLIDYWPAPHPWTPIEAPALYRTLASQPPGIVLEVPLGLRDGFGERGALDHSVLFYQTIHQHPQMGGFVARLSPRIKAAYESDVVLQPILTLSENLSPVSPPSGAPPAAAAPCRLTCDVRYVVINEAVASSELKAFVEQSFSLRLIERNGQRALYVVD